VRVRHPAGRGGRLWLSDRLDLARRAADLLVQKERVLLREQRRLVVLHDRTLTRWDDACRDAQAWMARAAALRGRRVVGLQRRDGEASADLVWRNSMGAYYPAEATCSLPEADPATDLAGTSAMTEASRAHRRALAYAVEHAATRRAVTEVERELAATRRRLRMLERHWTPALSAALHDLDVELEERERDDAVHARWSQREGMLP
jgi:V/A-type H+/Na+-transporting ATPase subunit D